MDAEREELLRKMRETRSGVLLPLHESLVKHDLEFTKLWNQVGYLPGRIVGPKTKELILITASAAAGAPVEGVKIHIVRAFNEGATKQEVVDAIELALGAAGIPPLMRGFAALEEVLAEQSKS